MNRKCGCCFSHPLQFPRENWTFCGGSGFREVIEVDSTYVLKRNFIWDPETKRSKSKTQTASKERNRKKQLKRRN
jgi:hypothetical protein